MLIPSLLSLAAFANPADEPYNLDDPTWEEPSDAADCYHIEYSLTSEEADDELEFYFPGYTFYGPEQPITGEACFVAFGAPADACDNIVYDNTKEPWLAYGPSGLVELIGPTDWFIASCRG